MLYPLSYGRCEILLGLFTRTHAAADRRNRLQIQDVTSTDRRDWTDAADPHHCSNRTQPELPHFGQGGRDAGTNGSAMKTWGEPL